MVSLQPLFFNTCRRADRKHTGYWTNPTGVAEYRFRMDPVGWHRRTSIVGTIDDAEIG